MTGKAGVALTGLLLLVQALAAGAVVEAGGSAPAARAEWNAEGRADGRDLSYALPPGFLAPITPERMTEVVAKLQSFGTRYFFTERATEAAAYIEHELSALGLRVSRQDFIHNSFMMSNVLAVLPGRNASLPSLVLGAHYDSLNGSSSYQDPYAPAPGADDDASGVAAVLAVAEAFSRARTERTIIFTAFAGEEIGRAGSIEFVRQANLASPGIYAGLVFDMIGYNHRYPKVDLVTNRGSDWLAGIAAEAGRRNALGVGTEHVITPDNPQNWSDHVSFWEGGLPAMCFIEDENPTVDSPYFEANPYYHTGQDTLDKLNATLMAKVARLGAAAAAALSGLALPDFAVEDIDRPAEVFEGDGLTVGATVADRGAGGSFPANVSLEVDGVPVEQMQATADGRLEMRWNATRGSHTISVVADSDDRHLEWNESDNIASFALDVRIRPDVRVADFWATDGSPVPGRAMTLVVLLENAGGATGEGRLVIYKGDGSEGLLADRPVVVPPGDLSVVMFETVAPPEPAAFAAEARDVSPSENVTDNNRLTLQVTPDVLDPGDFRVVIEPDVVQTFEEVRVSVEGADASFDWFLDFGDGRSAGWTGSPHSHFYRRSGTHFVCATLRDAKGAVVALEPMPVTVSDRPPRAVIEIADAPAAPGRAVAFSGARSRDPDGAIVTYLWDFGEGAKGFGVAASHTYSTPGRYPVRLTVTDDRGRSNTTLLDLEVVNRPPVARATADRRLLLAGETAAFNGSASYDAEGAPVSYLWDFGDGTNASGPLAGHAFPDVGSYRVTLTVSDGWGATGSTAFNITVLERLPPPDTGPSMENPALVPALLLAMVLIALVLILRGRHTPEREEEE